MSFDHMQLMIAHKMTQTAESMVQKAQENLERNRLLLKEERTKLIDAVKGIFEEELQQFPAEIPFRIWKDGYCFVIDVERRSIGLDVLLKDNLGAEPNAYFTEKDRSALSERFASVINPRLVKEEISFTFGGFIFPPEYLNN